MFPLDGSIITYFIKMLSSKRQYAFTFSDLHIFSRIFGTESAIVGQYFNQFHPPPPFSTHTVRILLLDAEHIVFVVTLTFHCDTHTHPMHTYPSYNCPLNGNAFSLANQLFPLYLMMCATIQVRKHFKIIFFIRLRWIFHVTSIWYMFDLCDFCHFYRISSHTHTLNFLVNCFPQNVIWTIAVASTKNSTATKLIVRFFCSCVCVCSM